MSKINELRTLRYVIVKSTEEENVIHPYYIVDTDDVNNFNFNTGESTEYYKTKDNVLICVSHVLVDPFNGGVYDDVEFEVGEIIVERRTLCGLSEYLTFNLKEEI